MLAALVANKRIHNKALIPKTYLNDRDYIMRMLYKNCYYPTVGHPAVVLLSLIVLMLFAILETFILLSISLLVCMYII